MPPRAARTATCTRLAWGFLSGPALPLWAPGSPELLGGGGCGCCGRVGAGPQPGRASAVQPGVSDFGGLSLSVPASERVFSKCWVSGRIVAPLPLPLPLELGGVASRDVTELAGQGPRVGTVAPAQELAGA